MFKKVVLLSSLCCLGLSAAAQQQQKAYIVSNAHFDSQWNWDVQRSIREYIPKTLDQNLMLLDKYPNYIFNFEGGIKYAWMKEYFPFQYERMKQYIKEGRWHVTGSTWDATDTNIPSPESFTRNILYGQHFYRDEFGVEGTDIFLPDCFGFGWTLPTIAAHSGLIGFSTQKLQWRHKPFHGNSKIPFHIGLWQGVDGARIMLVADAHNYTTKWKDEDLSRNKELMRLTEQSPLHLDYHYYGTGDTGGAPTIESVRAVEKGLKGNGPVQIVSATSDQLYKDYLPFSAHPELPVYDGELLMDVHGTGCYTSQAAMKLYNRRNELLGDAAERAAVAAHWLGAVAYPREVLTEAWKRFIWHQFHDDLTGTSLPRAYEFSWNDELISLKQFGNVLTTSVGGVSRALDTRVKGLPLVVYNPAAFATSDAIEVSVPLGRNVRQLAVYDEAGKLVPSQLLTCEGGVATLLVRVSVPALGYVVYDVRTQAGKSAPVPLQVTANSIENSVYKVTLDANGDIASILDKRCGKELVAPGKSLRLALFTENKSMSWPAWEILKSEIDKAPVSLTEGVKIRIAEQGPLRAALCVERTYGASTFKQYIRLTEGGESDRIDLLNEVDWQSSNALLKAEFPLAVSNPKATYDLGVGTVQRGNNTDIAYEVYAQQWADLTDASGSYGVSILNDSKYGWDKPADNTLRLTLLHTPGTGTNYHYQNKQDLGKHVFTYSIVGHMGDYRQGETVRKAEALNQPAVAFVAPKHKGFLGKSFAMAQTDNRNVVLKAFKQAEKSDEFIVRFYETSGKGVQQARVSFAAPIAAAVEVNGVEDRIGEASYQQQTLSFDIRPYSIKTFKVKLQAPAQQLTAPAIAPVALPYNMKTASYNAFRRGINFDGKGKSFAAELLPQQLTLQGVDFHLAAPDTLNGLKCRGERIALPQGNYNRLYVLAAATGADSRVTFRVDGKAHEVVVPSYAEFIGQWGHSGHTEGYLKSADIAFVGTHRHDMMRNCDLPYEFTYIFSIPLQLPAGAKELELPDDSRIVLFAATVARDENNQLQPASDLLKVHLPAKEVDETSFSHKNLLYGCPLIEKSGEVNAREKAEFAIDENADTKWCDVGLSREKFVAFDLGGEKELRGWHVLHASLESLDYTTKEYSLQVKSALNDPWKTVDTVTDNVDIETDRLLQVPVKARYVRLSITKPDQSEGRTARIYEFSVY